MELLTPGGAAYQGRNYEPHDEKLRELVARIPDDLQPELRSPAKFDLQPG